jgi:hypothetical protein
MIIGPIGAFEPDRLRHQNHWRQKNWYQHRFVSNVASSKEVVAPPTVSACRLEIEDDWMSSGISARGAKLGPSNKSVIISYARVSAQFGHSPSSPYGRFPNRFDAVAACQSCKRYFCVFVEAVMTMINVQNTRSPIAG